MVSSKNVKVSQKRCLRISIESFKPGFHSKPTPRPRHKKQSDYVVGKSSLPLIALFWLKIGRCRGRNWLKGAAGSADLQISKSALLSLNHHNFSNTTPIYTE